MASCYFDSFQTYVLLYGCYYSSMLELPILICLLFIASSIIPYCRKCYCIGCTRSFAEKGLIIVLVNIVFYMRTLTQWPLVAFIKVFYCAVMGELQSHQAHAAESFTTRWRQGRSDKVSVTERKVAKGSGFMAP